MARRIRNTNVREAVEMLSGKATVIGPMDKYAALELCEKLMDRGVVDFVVLQESPGRWLFKVRM